MYKDTLFAIKNLASAGIQTMICGYTGSSGISLFVFGTDEGVLPGMLVILWQKNWTVEQEQKYWRVIHTFYRLKKGKNDNTDYNMETVKTKENTYARLARWILFDHQDPIT